MDIYIDGSSMGNPGDAGVGVIFAKAEVPVKNISRYIGRQTNNVAEYTALITALQEALEMNVREATIFSDSQLLCRQINGEYKVKNKNIKHLFEQQKCCWVNLTPIASGRSQENSIKAPISWRVWL
jgi:ribonuclease HI